MNKMENSARTTKIDQLKKEAMSLLQRGDIIRLEPGMKVYADMPNMFRGGAFFDTDPCHHDVIIGQVYKKEATSLQNLIQQISDKIGRIVPASEQQISAFVESLNLDLEEKTFDASVYAGEYKVIFAISDGGGHCHDGDYPNGWHVFCQKVDDPSVEVDFYQTGCFTAMIENIQPINR